MEKTGIFDGLGLDVLANEHLFSEPVGSLGDRRVVQTWLGVESTTNEKGETVERLVTAKKSQLTVKNWLKSLFSFLFRKEDPNTKVFKNKVYNLDAVADFTKRKINIALEKINKETKNQGLNNFCDKISYLKKNNHLSASDEKILNNIYHIANRAHFYHHDNVKLFETVSKIINKNTGKIFVYDGLSIHPKKQITDFRWNPQMNSRFIALESLGRDPHLSSLNLKLGFGEIMYDKEKNPNELVKEEELIDSQNKKSAHIRFEISSKKTI